MASHALLAVFLCFLVTGLVLRARGSAQLPGLEALLAPDLAAITATRQADELRRALGAVLLEEPEVPFYTTLHGTPVFVGADGLLRGVTFK
eukprot:EST49430.1 Hypothetical protein SS50377_10260 [Spironucleus salmonicida]